MIPLFHKHHAELLTAEFLLTIYISPSDGFLNIIWKAYSPQGKSVVMALWSVCVCVCSLLFAAMSCWIIKEVLCCDLAFAQMIIHFYSQFYITTDTNMNLICLLDLTIIWYYPMYLIFNKTMDHIIAVLKSARKNNEWPHVLSCRSCSRLGPLLASIWRSCWWKPLLLPSVLPAFICRHSASPRST